VSSPESLDIEYVASLLKLSSDASPRVYRPVNQHLDDLGIDLLPFLKEIFYRDPELAPVARRWWGRLIMADLKADLRRWQTEQGEDLLTGITLMTQAAYPEISRDDLHRDVFQQILRVWMEAKSYYSLKELIQSINHTLFQVEGYQGNDEDFYAPENFFLHWLLAHRRGSPLTLSILYILIGQRLGVPVFGVNLPYHFVVAVMENAPPRPGGFPAADPPPFPQPDEKVAFYINTYRKGAVFFHHQLKDFLVQIGHEPRPEYFQPCTNTPIVTRMARNLEVAYERIGDEEMAGRYRALREVLDD